jgi:hypothetical protein
MINEDSLPEAQRGDVAASKRTEEMASLNIKRADFHGEWNYTIASID